MSVAKVLTFVLMTLTTTMASCPYPVQYPLEPEEGNLPPVVNKEYTNPYMVMETGVEVSGTPPSFTIVVDDPNPNDDLSVKIIKELHHTWLPQNPPVQHELMLWERTIGPLFTVTPEDASNMGVPETTRMASVDLYINPCAGEVANSEVFLWVCVADTTFEAPGPDYPNEDPCIPKNGFVDQYPVIVTCIESNP